MLQVAFAIVFLVAPPKKAGKITHISKAVRSANLMIQKLDVPDNGARGVIDDSEVFMEEFKGEITVRRVEYKDKELIIRGTITVKHPDRERYRTLEEREQIEELNLKIKRLKQDRAAAIDVIKDEYRPEGKQSAKEAARRRNLYQSKLRHTKREYNDAEKKLRKRFVELVKKIRVKEHERRDACEILEVEARFSDYANMNVPEITKIGKLDARFTIEAYELSAEPLEMGGRPQIEALVINASEFKE